MEPSSDLLVLGIKGEKAPVLKKLTEWGFDIVALIDGKESDFSLSLKVGKKLCLKTIVELGMFHDPKKLDLKQKTRIAQHCLHDITSKATFMYSGVYLSHHFTELEQIIKSVDVDKIEAYFGPKIAFYFAWVGSYVKNLCWILPFSLIVFIIQTYSGQLDIQIIPLFNILLAIWSTLFVELWKRENASIAFKWGVYGVEDEEIRKDIIINAGKSKNMSTIRLIITTAINVFILYLILRLMVFFVWWSHHAHEIYGEKSLWRFYPMVMYSIVPLIAYAIYEKLAIKMTQWEAHVTKSEYENNLIIKIFAFQFINCYSALIYIAFWESDFHLLHEMLASLLITKQIIGNITESGIPWLLIEYNHYMRRSKASKNMNDSNRGPVEKSSNQNDENKELEQKTSCPNDNYQGGASLRGDNNQHENLDGSEILSKIPNEAQAVEELNNQIIMSDCDISSDYLEMIIQYGYVTMFSVAFPLAPFFALINNYAEIRLDLWKMSKLRRPNIIIRSSIGSWLNVLEFVNIAGVITNTGLMIFNCSHLHLYLSSELLFLTTTFHGKVFIAFVVEHLLLSIKWIMGQIISDVPFSIRKQLILDEIKKSSQDSGHRKAALEAEFSKHESQGPSRSFPGSIAQTKNKYGDSISLYGIDKLIMLRNNEINFSPIWVVLLALVPYIIQNFNLSGILIIPISVVTACFLFAKKQQREFGTAPEVVCDEELLKHVLKEIPNWYYDSDVERVEWLNKVIQQAWCNCGIAVNGIIQAKVQPILDGIRPSFLTTLKFREFDLGQYPPKITGVRVFQTDESLVRMIVEIKWAGNPNISLEIGRKELPLTLAISEICLSGNLLIEFNPLIDEFPLFAGISLMLMQEPQLDFTFKMCNIDGPLGRAVVKIATKILKQVVSNLMVHPKHLNIPLCDVLNQEKVHGKPLSLLELTVVRSNNLRASDVKTSDPYVVIKLGKETKKTKVNKFTLNPEWNENFTFLIFSADIQEIEFSVYDWNQILQDEFLGRASLDLTQLESNVSKRFEIVLKDTDRGTIVVDATLSPFADSTHQVKEEITLNDFIDENGNPILREHTLNENDSTLNKSEMDSFPILHHSRTMSDGPRPVGTLSISKITIKVLKNTKKIKLKPCVRFTLGHDQQISKVTTGSDEIHLQEEFSFTVSHPENDELHIQVIQEKSGLFSHDKSIGRCSVRIVDVLNNNNKIEKDWPLLGDHFEGSIRMNLVYDSVIGREKRFSENFSMH